MRAQALLKEIEPLRHSERCRRLAGLRRLSGERELRDLLDELNGGGYYERSLALFIATAVRDEASRAHIERAMGDPATDVALAAVTGAVRVGLPYERLAEALRDAPAALRNAAYRAIRRNRCGEPAERLIAGVAERWGEREAAALLPACGERVVRERLDGLAHAVSSWAAFAHSHPGPMLDFAERALAATPDPLRHAWWARHAPGVAAAIPHDAGRVVTLLEHHCPPGPLPYALRGRLGVLFDAEPARTLRLILAEEHRAGLPALIGRKSVRNRLAGLGGVDAAAEVARAVRDDPRTLATLLKAFPPSRREELFTAATAGTDRATAELDEQIMQVLPHDARAREARRMLTLRRVSEIPHRVWEVTSYLPYEEARPLLREVTRRPDADQRAAGYRLLILCAGRARDAEVLARLLEEDLGRLRNEQDPVRASALAALASVPAGLLRAPHAVAIARITEDALNARDGSPESRGHLTRLATRICHQGAIGDDTDLLMSGLDTLRRLASHGGGLRLYGLAGSLRRGQEHDLVRTLAPQLEAWARRQDHRPAFALARALDRRAHDVPLLQDMLEKALDARDDGDIREAVDLWLAPPRTRAERVARVVKKDPSTVWLPAVFRAIARERTDLLHLALSGRTPKGRFRHPRVTYVPSPERSWMRRWTARQRAAYLALLHRLARDAGTARGQRARAVRSIGAIPGVDPAELDPYFDADEPFLRRMAETAAVWTASPQHTLTRLLDLASSDDAHVAVYAASRAARFVAPSALSRTLSPVLTDGKITARKEALRILLRDRAPDAMDVLTAAWDDPGQHRDVRVAVASAVRERLDDPRAVRILNEAARGPRDLALQVIRTSPDMIEERHRPAYAALILDIARSEDAEAAEHALPALQPWVSWVPAAPALLADHLTRLERVSTWRGALISLLVSAKAGHGLAELGEAAARLAAAPGTPDAGAERDRPARQRLDTLVQEVRLTHGREGAGRAEPLVRALTGRLPQPAAAELIAATIPWHTPGVETDLDALAARPVGGVFAVMRVARSLAAGRYVADLDQSPYVVHDGPYGPGAEVVLPHAERLAARADLAPGLFACALAEYHGELSGWPEEWRAVLRRLRAHPHPDVAYTAAAIRTAGE